MTEKHIFLIRHGETEFNKQGIIQGCGIDSDLNETGRKQALAFFEHYKNQPFNKIYVSTLKRTWQTVEPFLSKGIPIEKHAGLNEISWGKFEGTNMKDSPQFHFEKLIHAWRNGETNLAVGGGESPEDVAERQKPVLDLIFSRTEEKNILICMHGRAMRIFLCQLFRIPLKEMDRFLHANTALYHLIYDYKTDSIYAHAENCLKHLEM
ncbi:MAG: histidine phosphatase family protein [Sphingobacteriales bacterium]|nr:MAG: histidine phosphatase family protein [Sphingobacteriales bacterium]